MFQKNYVSLDTLMRGIASEVHWRAKITQQHQAVSARASICLQKAQNNNSIWSTWGVFGLYDNSVLMIFSDIYSFFLHENSMETSTPWLSP